MAEVSQEELIQLAHRIVNLGESFETIARDQGVSKADLRQAVLALEKINLISGLVELAPSFRKDGEVLKGLSESPFKFPEINQDTPTGPIKVYRPDVVWFAGEPSEGTTTVIFEIEVGTSPKHRMGGWAFANILALKYSKPMWFFFAIVPRKSLVITNSIELSKLYLGLKWALRANVIHGFQLIHVEESVRKLLHS